MSRIPVYLHTNDVISRAGLASQLRPQPRVRVLEPDEHGDAEVALVVADSVDESTVRVLRTLRSRGINRLFSSVGALVDLTTEAKAKAKPAFWLERLACDTARAKA